MIETRELSREVPLLVGHLPSSDIQIDAEGVAPIHCRISWQHKNFEVTAASPEGVQFNGTTVRHHLLTPGDVLRVGDVDIVLVEESRNAALAQAAPPSDGDTGQSPNLRASQYELQPLSEESLPVRSFHIGRQFASDAASEMRPAAVENSGQDEAPAAAGSEKTVREPPDVDRRAGMNRVAQVVLGMDELARDEAEAPAIDPPRRQPALTLAGAAG